MQSIGKQETVQQNKAEIDATMKKEQMRETKSKQVMRYKKKRSKM